MKLWLLDADVIIKLLEMDVFEKLVAKHNLHVASTVVDEVKYFRRDGQKYQVDFREHYINSGRIIEKVATVEEIQKIYQCLPPHRQNSLHMGEIESIAILVHQEDLILCTFDMAAIRTLPFLDIKDRAISAERLLQSSGLAIPAGHTDPRLSESYFKSNIDEGTKDFLYHRKF